MVLLFKFLADHFHDEISVLLYLLDEEAPPMSYSNKGLVNYFLRITWLKKCCLFSFGDEAVSVLIVHL